MDIQNWANFYLTGVSFLSFDICIAYKFNQYSEFWNWHLWAKFHPHYFVLVNIPKQCHLVAVKLDRIFSNKKHFQTNSDVYIENWFWKHKTQFVLFPLFHLYFFFAVLSISPNAGKDPIIGLFKIAQFSSVLCTISTVTFTVLLLSSSISP